MKGLFYRDSFLGELGKKTGFVFSNKSSGWKKKTELRVGDIVSFVEYDRTFTKVVVMEENVPGIFGFGSDTLEFEYLTKIMGFEHLTEDIFNKLQEAEYRKAEKGLFSIRPIKEKELTISEIEEKLGYKIKVISNKEGG